MQSTIVSNVMRISRVLSLAPTSIQSVTPVSRGFSTFMPTGKPADSNIHGEETEVSETMTQGIDTEQGKTGDYSSDQTAHKSIGIDDIYVSPNAPNRSSPRLEGTPVNKPCEPVFQQKRHKSSSSAARFENVSCAGVDLSQWLNDDRDIRRLRKEQEEDDRHKASPLSEIEVADTRKPITRVTDGTAGGYFGGERVITWRPEQLDTAEESLLRATEIWRESARRGVPEWPHSRRLRELRGEDW